MTAAALVEPATEEDVGALVTLERLCFSHPWTPRNFADAMAEPPGGRVVVVRVPYGPADRDRGIAAYCAYALAGGELHVHNLAVHPGDRRQGWARLLMRVVLGLAARKGATVALLEVRRSNEAARRLYETLGFSVRATRRDYYSRPIEDALVMERPLP